MSAHNDVYNNKRGIYGKEITPQKTKLKQVYQPVPDRDQVHHP